MGQHTNCRWSHTKMKKYHYKALIENPDCGVKRAVVFEDDRFLNWRQAGREAIRHMSSQTCIRCDKNHKNDSYCLIELERGEQEWDGGYNWRYVYPDYKKSNQWELPI